MTFRLDTTNKQTDRHTDRRHIVPKTPSTWL